MAIAEDTSGILNKIKWTWTCTSAGAYAGASTNRYNGIVLKLITVPAGGGDAPTTLYDITITDGDSVDVLGGAGADRSTTLQEVKAQSDGLANVKSSLLTLNVSNAGDIKQGTVILYIMDTDKRQT